MHVCMTPALFKCMYVYYCNMHLFLTLLIFMNCMCNKCLGYHFTVVHWSVKSLFEDHNEWPCAETMGQGNHSFSGLVFFCTSCCYTLSIYMYVYLKKKKNICHVSNSGLHTVISIAFYIDTLQKTNLTSPAVISPGMKL